MDTVCRKAYVSIAIIKYRVAPGERPVLLKVYEQYIEASSIV